MDLQVIRLSSLEQVRMFPLWSILLQCAAFPYCLSNGRLRKQPTSHDTITGFPAK